MNYCYFPGCTLTAGDGKFDISARRAAETLGFSLCELREWQCCGGVYPSALSETAPKLPAVRALKSAKDSGKPLAAVCSACCHVLKSVNYDMKNSPAVRDKANSYLENEPPYDGGTRVVHYLEILRDDVGFDNVRHSVKNPLNIKIAPYYGCLLLRPSEIMCFDDPENPRVMEDFIASLGGDAVVYPMRGECCGGYISAEDENITRKRCLEITRSAKSHGARMIAAACPLCLYNLQKYSDIPVKFFTEILCDALGIEVTDGD